MKRVKFDGRNFLEVLNLDDRIYMPEGAAGIRIRTSLDNAYLEVKKNDTIIIDEDDSIKIENHRCMDSSTFRHDGMVISIIAPESEWAGVKEAALTTIHKKATSSEITSAWKKAMIIGRHSPIREFRIKIKIENIPRWIADQLVRHNVGVNNYMGTMRSDRGNVPRNEQRMSDVTVFQQTYNIDSFINMCTTRLCVGTVSKETNQLVAAIVEEMFNLQPEIALFCAPPCVSLLACKENPLRVIMKVPSCSYLNRAFPAAGPSTLFLIEERFTAHARWRFNYES